MLYSTLRFTVKKKMRRPVENLSTPAPENALYQAAVTDYSRPPPEST
jgi:hypothetical protein